MTYEHFNTVRVVHLENAITFCSDKIRISFLTVASATEFSIFTSDLFQSFVKTGNIHDGNQ